MKILKLLAGMWWGVLFTSLFSVVGEVDKENIITASDVFSVVFLCVSCAFMGIITKDLFFDN